MKPFFFFSLLLGISLASTAQCGKSLVLTSSKTEYLDTSMTVQRTVDEKSTVALHDSVITITTSGDGHEMTGTITATTCKWTVPYKTGKSIIKTVMNNDNGDQMHMTLTIEGNNGKLTLLAEVQEMQDQKIRVAIDTFEERK